MSRDVVVIGGGAIGASCALALARRGAEVTLLEAGAEVGAGCSAGNAGLLCPSHSAPLATRAALLAGLRWSLAADAPFALRPRVSLVPWLARFAAACTPARERHATDLLRGLSCASLALFEQLQSEIGVQVKRTGTLNVYPTERSFSHGCREAGDHAGAGMEVEILTPKSAAELEPALQGPVAGAIFFPGELSGDPLEFVRTVGRAATEAGADVRTATEALRLRTARNRVTAIETTAGTIEAKTVVLAAGAWSRRLAGGLALHLPIEAAKGYHIDYPDSAGDPHVPIFLHGSRVVVTPLPGRLRLAGTLELSGFDLSVDPRRVGAVARAGANSIRGLAGRRASEVWRGLRPCAPDGLPIIGRTAAYENLVLAGAHATLGFTLAPITALLVTQLVVGETPDHDLTALSPDRFGDVIRGAARRA